MPACPPATFPRLVGDVGGTNARFGMVLGPGGGIERVQTFACADFPGPREALEHYLALDPAERPRWCAIGIANPVDGDEVRMTNHHWRFSIQGLRNEMGFERLLVLNDFAALAQALPVLPRSDLVQVGGGSPAPRRAIALIGPGTGLGVSGLVPCGDDFAALEGEGGHVTLAAGDAHEAAIVAWLAKRHSHVSAERVLSGPGLVNLYEAHAALAGRAAQPLTPREISGRALSGACPLCEATLRVFCAMLGSAAGDLALILGARGGVHIGGGIVPRLGGFLAHSAFRARFEQKGRFTAYLAAIPTYVINAPYPGLLGAARALESAARGERA